MNAILISIRPKWCELIALGTKTVEVRKTRPELEMPFKCYIYETKDAKYENMGVYEPKAPLYKNFLHHPGKVIGEFVCDRIDCYAKYGYAKQLPRYMNSAVDGYPATEIHYAPLRLTPTELDEYGKGRPLCGWHISDLKIYDKPRELGDFQWICDHKEDCGSCKRFDAKNYGCIAGITRPPQSWMFVEEM